MKKENEVLGPSKGTRTGYKSSRLSVYGTRARLKIIILSEQSQVPPASPNGECILFDVLHIKFCKNTNGRTETGSSPVSSVDGGESWRRHSKEARPSFGSACLRSSSCHDVLIGIRIYFPAVSYAHLILMLKEKDYYIKKACLPNFYSKEFFSKH